MKQVRDSEEISLEICSEIRRIIRKKLELEMPLFNFIELPERSVSIPRYQVILYKSAVVWNGEGLRVGVKRLSWPEEFFEDMALDLARALWHLNDRVWAWCKLNNVKKDHLHEQINQSTPILVTQDLCTHLKHGEHGNRSRLNPYVSGAILDTSENGLVEFQYNGHTMQASLLVEHPVPIPFRVPIYKGPRYRWSSEGGDSVDREEVADSARIFRQALIDWGRVIRDFKILDQDYSQTERHQAIKDCLFPLIND